MRKILVIWGYWILFLAVGLGLVRLVEHGDRLPAVATSPPEQSILDNPPKELITIQGDEWVSLKPTPLAGPLPEEEVWTPLESLKPTFQEDPSQTATKTDFGFGNNSQEQFNKNSLNVIDGVRKVNNGKNQDEPSK